MIKALVIPTTGIYKNMEFNSVDALHDWVNDGLIDSTLYSELSNNQHPYTGIRVISDMQEGDRPKNILGLMGRVVFVNVDANGDVHSLTQQQIKDIRLAIALAFVKEIKNA